MSKEKIGNIGGRDIYVDTGEDQIKILLETIHKRLEHKKLKAGQTFMLPVDFEEPLVAEIKILPWTDK